MLNTVVTVVNEIIPRVLSLLVGLFSDASDADGGVLAGLVGEGLARWIPDRSEDEIGRFLVAVGDALVQANPPVPDDSGSG